VFARVAGSVGLFGTFRGSTWRSGEECVLGTDSLEPFPVLRARILGSALRGTCVSADDHAGGGNIGNGGTSGTAGAASHFNVAPSGLLLDLVFAEDIVDGCIDVDGLVMVQDFVDREDVRKL
jgi:hypothetical protein